MKRHLIKLLIVLITANVIAIQQAIDKDYCNKRKKEIERLELKLSPANKQSIVQESRRVSNILLDDAKKELTQLQAMADNDAALTAWYKNKMHDMLHANQQLKEYLEKELDTHNTDNLLAEHRQLILQHIKALDYFLNETQDANVKQQLQEGIDRNNHLLRLTDAQMLDIIVPPLRDELKILNQEIEDATDKSNATDLTAHAQNYKKHLVEQHQKNIDSYNHFRNQTDDQIYDSTRENIVREVTFAREMLEKYCK